jgi:hypothetical protein
MEPQRFTASVWTQGSLVGIVLPFDPNAVWGEKSRHDVTGTVGGRWIRGPLQRYEHAYVLALGPAWRRDADFDLSQPLDVELQPESPRVEELPEDIAQALIAMPEARHTFESIAPFYRKNYIRWIVDAKRPETRAVRIAEAVRKLAAGQRQR